MKTHIELNFEERECLRYLALATNCFMKLDKKHPDVARGKKNMSLDTFALIADLMANQQALGGN